MCVLKENDLFSSWMFGAKSESGVKPQSRTSHRSDSDCDFNRVNFEQTSRCMDKWMIPIFFKGPPLWRSDRKSQDVRASSLELIYNLLNSIFNMNYVVI